MIDPPATMFLGATVRDALSSNPRRASRCQQAPTQHQRPAGRLARRSKELTVSLQNVRGQRFDPGTVVISQGLDGGEIVVTAGVQALHPGQKVRLLGARRDRAQSVRMGTEALVRHHFLMIVVTVAGLLRTTGLAQTRIQPSLQDDDRAGGLARRNTDDTLPAGDPSGSSASCRKRRGSIPAQLHQAGVTTISQPQGLDVARRGSRRLVPGSARTSATSATRCRRASSVPASTTISATRSPDLRLHRRWLHPSRAADDSRGGRSRAAEPFRTSRRSRSAAPRTSRSSSSSRHSSGGSGHRPGSPDRRRPGARTASPPPVPSRPATRRCRCRCPAPFAPSRTS